MDLKPSQTQGSLNSLDTTPLRAIQQMLLEWLPKWREEPAEDLRRSITPTGPGAYSIELEQYRGMHAFLQFRRKLMQSEGFKSFEQAIRASKPELFGVVYYPGGASSLGDQFAIATNWCVVASRYMDEGMSVEEAVERLTTELSGLLATGVAVETVLTVLSGLKIPDHLPNIEFEDGLCVRNLKPAEVREMGSNDVYAENRQNLTSQYATAAIAYTRKIPMVLETIGKTFELNAYLLHQQEGQQKVDAILASLHLVKAGRVGVAAGHASIEPNIFPNMSSQYWAPMAINPFPLMELSGEEVLTLQELYRKYCSSQRDEIHIAARRLLDSENRLSPVDSLLDSVIGLDVLLNPQDRDELSFRVALNFAFLGAPAERRHRFERVRDIQKIRNRVVHGGLNLHSKDAHLISAHAELGKQCLREAIRYFLADEFLSGNAKISVDYWLDRMIPKVS